MYTNCFHWAYRCYYVLWTYLIFQRSKIVWVWSLLVWLQPFEFIKICYTANEALLHQKQLPGPKFRSNFKFYIQRRAERVPLGFMAISAYTPEQFMPNIYCTVTFFISWLIQLACILTGISRLDRATLVK